MPVSIKILATGQILQGYIVSVYNFVWEIVIPCSNGVTVISSVSNKPGCPYKHKKVSTIPARNM
jgi:hypothetical protein